MSSERPFAWLAVLLAIVAGCAGAVDPGDAGLDAAAPDASTRDAAPAIDAASIDAGRDAFAPIDAGTDTPASDAGADAGPDAATCDPGPLTTVRAFYEAEFAAFCAYYARCVPGLAFFGGAASCTELNASQYEGTIDAIQALVDSGRTHFDPSAAAACVASLACAECGDFEEAVFACPSPSTLLGGTLADGAPCTTDYECSGGECDDPPGCGNAGTCRRQPVEGEACTSGGTRCRLPAICNGSVCATLALSAPGDPCPTGSCSGELQCWAGTCHNPFDAMHLALGEPCMTFGPDQCSIGLACPSSGGVCEATQLPLGAPCVPAGPDPCALGLYCDGTTCAALPVMGQPCQNGVWCGVGFACRCPTDASCTFTDEVCIAMHHVGQACSTNVSCWSGSCVGGLCATHDVCD